MITRKLKDIVKMVSGKVHNETDTDIKGVSTDTRTLKKGNLYIPIIGEKFNGHHFLAKAIEMGASASLWSEKEIPNVDIPLIIVDDTLKALQRLAKEYRDNLDVKIVGITGTNGKTSTKDILGSILKQVYNTKVTKGNLNNHIGVPLTLLSLSEDTEVAVVEMGMSNIGEIELLTKIASPDVAVITNVGSGHLEYLKTIENVAKAKLEILTGLKSDGLFIYNGDDSILKKAINNLNIKQKVKTFGKKNTDLEFKITNSTANGITLSIQNELFDLPMIGVHQAYNLAASILVAKYFDINNELIKNGLKSVELSSMRNELLEAKNFYILNDAYNCNPESTKAAIDTFYSLKGYKQKIIVFADMLELGKNKIELHKEIGKLIDFTKIDFLLTYGELSKYTANEAKGNVFSFDDKDELIKLLKNIIINESIILLKGSRGMKLEYIANQLV